MPDQQEINEIDAKSQRNQRDRRQIIKKSMKSAPNHQEINEIDAKSKKKSKKSTPNQ